MPPPLVATPPVAPELAPPAAPELATPTDQPPPQHLDRVPPPDQELLRDEDLDAPTYTYPDHLPGMVRFSPVDGMELAIRSKLHSYGGWMGDAADLALGDPMQDAGFRLRRARFGLEGTLIQDVSFLLEVDLFDQEKTGGPLYQAWVDLALPRNSGVTLGVQQVPFSQGQGMSSTYLTHLARPYAVEAMAPQHAMGLVLYGPIWPDHVLLSLAVCNGLQRHPTFFQGYEGLGQSLGNRFEGLLYAAKLDIVPLGAMGDSIADVNSRKKLRFSTGIAGMYNDGSSVATRALSAYLHAKWRGFHLLGEVLVDHSAPQEDPTSTKNTLAAEVDRLATYVDLGYLLLPRRLGLSVRTEYLNAHFDRQDANDQLIVTGTLTYYMVRELMKIMLEASHREELYGEPIDNDAVLGGLQFTF